MPSKPSIAGSERTTITCDATGPKDQDVEGAQVAADAEADEALLPPRRFRTWEKAVAVLAVIAFLSALGFVTWRYADQPVRAQVISFDVVSAEKTTITVDVTKAPDRAAACTVEALSVSSAQVGVARFEVPADAEGPRTTRWLVDIPTQEEATTAVVDRCRLAESR